MNFDETSITFDNAGKKTVSFKGDKHVSVITNNQEKEYYTLGVMSNYTGSYLKATIIWPSAGIRSRIDTKI
jgi:hypothetical protein